MRTLNRLMPGDHRIQSLSDGIAAMIATGRMTTYHAASVLTALSELLETGRPVSGETQLDVGDRIYILNGETPLLVVEDTGNSDQVIRVVEGADVYIQAGYHGKPVAAPAEQPAESAGFAVQRRWSVLIQDDRTGRQVSLESAGEDIEIPEGAVVEEHIRIVNPEDRHYVVVHGPLAAGMEPLNPHLAISPPEAVPAGQNTRQPDYMEIRDHYVAYYYNTFPRGTYDFYFRTKAAFSGRFTQPGAYARMMYNLEQTGASPGVYVNISALE
jgi:alpha-2-macroglobulin